MATRVELSPQRIRKPRAFKQWATAGFMFGLQIGIPSAVAATGLAGLGFYAAHSEKPIAKAAVTNPLREIFADRYGYGVTAPSLTVDRGYLDWFEQAQFGNPVDKNIAQSIAHGIVIPHWNAHVPMMLGDALKQSRSLTEQAFFVSAAGQVVPGTNLYAEQSHSALAGLTAALTDKFNPRRYTEMGYRGLSPAHMFWSSGGIIEALPNFNPYPDPKEQNKVLKGTEGLIRIFLLNATISSQLERDRLSGGEFRRTLPNGIKLLMESAQKIAILQGKNPFIEEKIAFANLIENGYQYSQLLKSSHNRDIFNIDEYTEGPLDPKTPSEIQAAIAGAEFGQRYTTAALNNAPLDEFYRELNARSRPSK